MVSTSTIIAKRRMPWPFPHELVAGEDSFTAFFSRPYSSPTGPWIGKRRDLHPSCDLNHYLGSKRAVSTTRIGSRGSDPRLLRLMIVGLLDRTLGTGSRAAAS